MTIDYDKIRRLVSLVEENSLTELAVEQDGLSITIRAETPAEGAIVAIPAGQPGSHFEIQYDEVVEAGPAPAQPAASSEHLYQIVSPMVGVFYRYPSPDSPAFVEVGDDIEVGQTVALIEAMKVFSELQSEVAGRVVSLPVESGVLVQQGDVLAVVDTSVAPSTQAE